MMHARVFRQMLDVIFNNILQADFSRVRLFYMTTMRHNDLTLTLTLTLGASVLHDYHAS